MPDTLHCLCSLLILLCVPGLTSGLGLDLVDGRPQQHQRAGMPSKCQHTSFPSTLPASPQGMPQDSGWAPQSSLPAQHLRARHRTLGGRPSVPCLPSTSGLEQESSLCGCRLGLSPPLFIQLFFHPTLFPCPLVGGLGVWLLQDAILLLQNHRSSLSSRHSWRTTLRPGMHPTSSPSPLWLIGISLGLLALPDALVGDSACSMALTPPCSLP